MTQTAMSALALLPSRSFCIVQSKRAVPFPAAADDRRSRAGGGRPPRRAGLQAARARPGPQSCHPARGSAA